MKGSIILAAGGSAVALVLLAANALRDSSQPQNMASRDERTPGNATQATVKSPGEAWQLPSESGATSGSEGQLAYSFDSQAELAAAADAIVVVNVTASRPEPFSHAPFTVQAVTVLTAIKGPLQQGTTPTVVETGGWHSGRSKADGELGTPANVAMFGVPVMEPGETYLLFLAGPSNVGPVSENAWAVLSAVQGKMRIGSDGRLEFPGNRAEAAREAGVFAAPLAMEGKPLSGVVAEVRATLAAR